MTRNRHILPAFTAVLLVVLLGGCSLFNRLFSKSEEVFLGQYVTLPAQLMEEGNTYAWSYAELPEESALQELTPTDSAMLVWFKPDVVGSYEILLIRSVGGEIEEETFKYEVVLHEDGDPLVEAPPEHVAAFLATQADTVAPETTAVSTIPSTGEKREYLTKLVTPPASKKSKSVKSSATRRSSKRKAVKPKPNRADLIPQATKTYTIQVSAWPSLTDAQMASDQLLEQFGIDNYVQRAFFKDKDEVYYRIRVGNFPSYTDADTYAEQIRKQTDLPAWVDFVRQEM